MVKNRQRWKNNQVRKQRTKEHVCILGRKKSKVTLTQSPWEKREEEKSVKRVPSLVDFFFGLMF